MKDLWLKIGCFLTGYRYTLIRTCSELSAKRVKRYSAAILIICILWGFVGYAFTDRYVKSNLLYSIPGALIAIVIIIQIERIIILTPKGNRFLLATRLVIAISMAFIGSLIVDQMIFQKDIDQKKNVFMRAKIEDEFNVRSKVLKKQIEESTLTLIQKETERSALVEDLSKHPVISIYTHKKTSSQNRTDSLPSQISETTITKIPNPKTELLNPLDVQLRQIRLDKIKKDSVYLGLRSEVEKELKSNVGFLEEFDILVSILQESFGARCIWCVWLLIILGLELLVLISKIGEKENDYDKALQEQMELHYKRIALLANQ